jgi:mannosyl-3-phosphoglycerate phosphatase
MVDCVIFTDLDGSLLDASTYSYDAAGPALDRIAELRIPLILVSSKTRAEIEPLMSRLRLREPFVVENGGAIFIPAGYFPFALHESIPRRRYHVIEVGTPYTALRAALRDMAREFSGRLQGFGDMSEEEVARATGLSLADARLAKQREFDEPFILEGGDAAFEQLLPHIQARGLRGTRGGRFYHLMGANDKGTATVRLIQAYRRLAPAQKSPGSTIGIGDSLNDLPMLQVVDRPVLVQRPDGSYDPGIDLPHLIRAPAVGPAGWNIAVLDLLTPAE